MNQFNDYENVVLSSSIIEVIKKKKKQKNKSATVKTTINEYHETYY